MNERIQAAELALAAAVDTVQASGLGDVLHALIGEVWSNNLARHAPEEHGDTAKSLGIQCYENMCEIALRRFHGSEWSAPEDQWTIPDLTVAAPQGVLTFSVGGVQLITKKAPHAQGRSPRWDRFPEWDSESKSRLDIAQENARVLGGNALPHGAQAELELDGDAELRPGWIRHFMLVWAGDDQSGSTSAWLTVPVSWPEAPFAAIASLWHDETAAVRTPEPGLATEGAVQPTPEPVLRLKPRPAREDKL